MAKEKVAPYEEPKQDHIDQEELDYSTQQAEENGTSVFTVQLRKPLNYNGKTYESLSFDFDALTGADALDVEQELAMKRIRYTSKSFNDQYAIHITVRACKEPIGVDAFKLLGYHDYVKITTKARNFILSAEL